MKIKILVVFIAIASTLKAQPNDGVKTVFGTGNPHIGYFITPSCQIGEITGSTAIIPGIGAGIIFNNNISLDLKYKFIATENTPAGEDDNRLYLDGQWFGIRGEYILKPEKVVHLSFPLEVNLGEIELDLKDSFEDQNITVPSDEAWFVNIEPGVALEINLWRYMKLNLTAGYRFVSDITFRNLSEKDLMGFTYSAALKIGLF
jgi:hypothetical protein